ncbi:uncharacterized protein Z519_01966 [Cladophialophora bantiana CBS 173.52]|uniref:Uncharacterized protein n=1 Tax=Cladophialophora bantiana (strain ATCC 10958 / CBS 173.52 / CDC B-1940 / NIH 8579) TaxID=1442370 RepID=A0A0D2I0A1_CLAB1|nr:uncharacterized protein Z519_01966 [Cladophialophora bantiana CBS 173.52]KIW96575.1 hypothetical protein Z519_01966 [Cladophialophora bantiana CBS 173.52]
MTSNKATGRLFKYPPMERQDLNQSQLGSFKFTPVDPVINIQSLTQSAKLYLEKQISQRFPQGAALPLAAPSQNKLLPVSDMPYENLALYPNPSSTDADFFNKHIKPDLGDSRLRLGPAALRSAVEGAASPTKKAVAIHVQRESEGAAVSQHGRNNSFIAPEPVSSHTQIPIMDVTPTTFLLEGGFPGQNLSDSTSFSETLCVALENEQRAHKATRAALAQQIMRRAEVEDQLRKSRQQIASMTTTINNLGAIIKYNANKSDADTTGGHKKTDLSEEDEEAALKEFYREYQKVKDAAKEKAQPKGREQSTGKEYSEPDISAQKDVAGVVAAAACDIADDAQLYNLDLLKKPTFDDSADSALRRTLRKHFSIDETADDDKFPVTPAKIRPSINRLIDISPESLGGAKVKDEAEHENDMCVSQDQSRSNNPSNGSQQRLKASPKIPSQVRLLTTQNPVLELPAAIVAKYGQEPVASHEQALQGKSNGVNLHLSNFEVLLLENRPGKPPNDEHHGRLTPSSSLTSCDTGQSPTTMVFSAARPKSRITIQIGDDLHGMPKWLINKDNPVFESDQEKWQALGENGIAWRQNSPFIDHPVRYLPEDAAGNADAYRTVMIDAIPVGSTLADVLSVVRGGSLESIQLFPPIGGATSFMTARVVFNYEESAHNMMKNQEVKGGKAGDANRFKIKGVAVRCWMPTDPTYPRNDELERKVLGRSHASRIILISNIDEYIFNMIPYKIKNPHAHHVIEYSYTPDGCASIEFTNIKTAIKVMDLLERDGQLWNGNLQYDTDYTCTPYVKGEAMGN